MRRYAVAYRDERGRDYADNIPWVDDNFESLSHAKSHRMLCVNHYNLNDVTIFFYEGSLPQVVTWDFVQRNIID